MSARVCAKVSISAAPVPPDIEFRACMKALIAVFWRITSAKLLLVPVKAALTMRSEEHTSELQSLMRISYAVFCLKKKIKIKQIIKREKYCTCRLFSHKLIKTYI